MLQFLTFAIIEKYLATGGRGSKLGHLRGWSSEQGKHVTAKQPKVLDLHKMNDEKTPLVPPRYLKPHSWLKRNCCPCIPARYVLAVMSSLGFVNVYALRVNLSVAIVEMSNDTATLRNGSARVNKH